MLAHKYIKGFHRKRIMLFLLWIPLAPMNGAAQIAINSTNQAADASAIVDVSSTTKGFLPPRMTTDQRKAIASPAEGLVVYNTDHKAVEVFNGDVWTSNTGKFLCGCSQIQDADGNRYETVLIGSQCWMAENLRTGTRVDGSVTMANNGTIEKYCYDDADANCLEYGGLYQWDEMMQYNTNQGTQGICFNGWHLPTVTELETLIAFLGGSSVAGGKMKETGTVHWKEQSSGATNISGYTALGSGYYSDGNFFDLKGSFNIWTSNKESLGSLAYSYSIWDELDSTIQNGEDMSLGMSVRCIKN